MTEEAIRSAPASPLLNRPGAAPIPQPGAAPDPDAGVAWHYGDPLREQGLLEVGGTGLVDLSHREVVVIDGPDRLSWLHSLTTQHVSGLAQGESALNLVLSPHGHVEYELHVVDDGERTWITVEPGSAAGLVAFLDSMRFMLRVEVAEVTADWAVVFEPVREPVPGRVAWLTPEAYRPGPLGHRFAGREVLVPRAELETVATGRELAGSWAYEATRVAAGVPRFGLETDHRTIPHELGWLAAAVHLDKGCYRGQETVARVHNLGRPPRRLVLLHLDGSAEVLPAHGDAVTLDGRSIGFVGRAVQHRELGPIASAIVKRSIDPTATLAVGDAAAAQDVVVEA